MAGFSLLMRFVSKSYSVKLNGKLTPAVGFTRYEIGKAVYGIGKYGAFTNMRKLFPKYSVCIAWKVFVLSYDGQILYQSLGNDNPIKRVAMVQI